MEENKFNELQKEIIQIMQEIDNKIGLKRNIETTFIHLTEEIGEIARVIYKEKIKNNGNINKENLSDEIADVLILTITLGHLEEIDFEEALKKKIKKLKERYNL
jgi:NTP pyrophosphatase (non-canonical NTP hydrolase)